MASRASESAETTAGVGDLLTTLAREQGSAAHPYATVKLSSAPHAARDLADAAHYLCTLHGRHPGVVDLAIEKSISVSAPASIRDWAEAVEAGFARERAYLTRIVVAAGPIPSTAGQAESEAAVIGQRHALEMLAASDRAGCALGAAMALVLDWRVVRRGLDAAARRFSVDSPVCLLPTADATAEAAAEVADHPRIERALLFGAHQILIQQQGLWDLLESRHEARSRS
jgi:hypothetical protein